MTLTYLCGHTPYQRLQVLHELDGESILSIGVELVAAVQLLRHALDLHVHTHTTLNRAALIRPHPPTFCINYHQLKEEPAVLEHQVLGMGIHDSKYPLKSYLLMEHLHTHTHTHTNTHIHTQTHTHTLCKPFSHRTFPTAPPSAWSGYFVEEILSCLPN